MMMKMNLIEEKTHVELCAGIGGFHLAAEDLGYKTIFVSEIDKYALETYKANFICCNPVFKGDITLDETLESIPKNPSLLTAGFPCQPFSQIGKREGIKDSRSLIHIMIKAINISTPEMFILENVASIKNEIALEAILKENIDGYTIYFYILEPRWFGIPMKRKRLFIVGSRIGGLPRMYVHKKAPLKYTLASVFNGISSNKEIAYTIRVGGRSSGIHSRHNWDTYVIDGKERVLGVKECKKLMGFPDDFTFPVSKTQALKQLGNSISVDTAKALMHYLKDYMHHLED